jgi:hypothetical protein
MSPSATIGLSSTRTNSTSQHPKMDGLGVGD